MPAATKTRRKQPVAEGTLRLSQLADYMGLSKNTIYGWRARKKFPFKTTKVGRDQIVQLVEVDAWLADHKVKGRPTAAKAAPKTAPKAKAAPKPTRKRRAARKTAPPVSVAPVEVPEPEEESTTSLSLGDKVSLPSVRNAVQALQSVNVDASWTADDGGFSIHLR